MNRPIFKSIAAIEKIKMNLKPRLTLTNNNDINDKLKIILIKFELDYQISILETVFTLSKLCVNVIAVKKHSYVIYVDVMLMC